MKAPALLGIGFVHLFRERTGNSFQQFDVLRPFGLNKERYFPKVNRPLFAKCLHGIKYSVTLRITFPNVHRDTACCMYQQCMLFPFSYLRQKFYESGIFQ